MPDRPHVVVRVDASPEIGLGHVMRSLALARELVAAGSTVTICGSGIPPHLIDGMQHVEPSDLDGAEAVVALQPDLVVVDGYHFTADFFAGLDGHGIEHAVIDDNGDTAARRPAAVVNQNPHADPGMYECLDGDSLLLLGPHFAMFRREIVEAALLAPTRRDGTVFVGFGGSDPRQLTSSVVSQLAAEGLEVRVAIGPANPRRSELLTVLNDRVGVAVVEPADYATELATASWAVLAAGSSVLEAACLGTPALAVVVADNQRLLATAARDRGIVCEVVVADEHLPAHLARGIETLLAAAPSPHGRLDAGGARRVAQALLARAGAQIRLRPAVLDDAEFLFELRSDDEVRRQSFGAAPDWSQHLHWFREVIDDPDRTLMIVEAAAGPVGQIRLDDVGDHAVVSLAIEATARGRGVARQALGAATTMATGDLVAHVRPDNARSLAAFEAVGFVTESAGPDEIVLRWGRDRHTGRVTTT
jgi:UDP-2,4-diacetamido-2,4,6-trideoxy-beta-L-altropyranose hydrolase